MHLGPQVVVTHVVSQQSFGITVTMLRAALFFSSPILRSSSSNTTTPSLLSQVDGYSVTAASSALIIEFCNNRAVLAVESACRSGLPGLERVKPHPPGRIVAAERQQGESDAGRSIEFAQ